MTDSVIGSGGAYGTITLWNNATPVNSPVLWRGYMLDQVFTEYVIMNGGGSTPVELSSDPGTAFNGTAGSGPVVQTDLGGGWGVITCGSDNITLTRFEITQSGVNALQHGVLHSGGSSGGLHLCNGLLIHDITGDMFFNGAANPPRQARNCIGYNMDNGYFGNAQDVFDNNTIIKNTTFAANGRGGLRYVKARNNIVMHFGPTAGWGDFLNLAAGSSNNVSADGTGNLTGQTTTSLAFVSASSPFDFRIATGSNAEGYGLDLTANFTDSIDGTVRTVPVDAGASQIAGGGSASYSIVGNVPLTFSPAAIMDYTRHASIVGNVPLSLTPGAVMDFTQHPSIVGNIGLTLTPSSTMAHSKHPAIVGSVPLSLTPNAVTDFTRHAAVVGNVPLTLSQNAVMDFSQHPAITGAGQITMTPGALTDFTQHPAIIGSSLITMTPAAIMSKSGQYSITGNIGLTITPGALMDFTRHAAITGNGQLTLVPAAVMDVTRHRAIVGNTTITLTPAALLDVTGHHSIVGQGMITLTPAAAMSYTPGSFAITGNVTMSLTPGATMDFTRHASVIGSLTQQLIPHAILLYSGAAVPKCYEFSVIHVQDDEYTVVLVPDDETTTITIPGDELSAVGQSGVVCERN